MRALETKKSAIVIPRKVRVIGSEIRRAGGDSCRFESPDSVFGYTYRVRMLLQPSHTVAPLERPNRTVRVGRLFEV